jgi:hypothetical protein
LITTALLHEASSGNLQEDTTKEEKMAAMKMAMEIKMAAMEIKMAACHGRKDDHH